MGSISGMLKAKDYFEAMIDEKLSSLDIWIKKVEKSNKPYYLPPELMMTIRKFVQESYIYDFDLIVTLTLNIIRLEKNFHFSNRYRPKCRLS